MARFARIDSQIRANCLILVNRFRVPERTEPLFCESSRGLKIANLRFESIRANRSHVYENQGFSANRLARINSRESPRFALRIAGPSIRTPPHPPNKKTKIPAPKTRSCMAWRFSCRKKTIFQAPIRLAQPFPAPELRAKYLYGHNPDLLFLAFLDFLVFFCFFQELLASLSVFPSFPRILGVRKRWKILAFLVVFLAFSRKSKEKKIREGFFF